MNNSKDKIYDEDLYELLGLEITASESEIKKAYRKQALQCHPDKNPDNPDAIKQFHKLSRVLEILTDELARKAYDRVLKARKEAAIRHKQIDSKRQKLKEDLDARERNFKLGNNKVKTPEEELKDEIERLRKEGSKQLEEEMEAMMKQLYEDVNLRTTRKSEVPEPSEYRRIKLKWHCEKSDPENGGYNESNLNIFLSKYDDINVLVISAKKRGSALVEFKTRRGAEMALELERGLSVNPLTLQWVNPNYKGRATGSSITIKESDYESVTLTRLRQAEERKKLIEQMMAEEKD